MNGIVNREVVESQNFGLQRDELGDARRIDDALLGTVWAVSTTPEVYPCVYKDVRLIRTKPFDDIPALSVRFRILGEDQVELLHLELTRGSGNSHPAHHRLLRTKDVWNRP